MDPALSGRLTASPREATAWTAPPAGGGDIVLDEDTRAWAHVPSDVPPGGRLPLLVALHGAGGQAAGMVTMLRAAANRHGIFVVAPQAAGSTWDVIRGAYGPDVRALDRLLGHIFQGYPVDAARVAVSGFSDGASYALSLGIGNGNLLRHIIAWSPGFAAPQIRSGQPRFYVSHGTGDHVLPVDRCSRRLVPSLRSAGYEVVYDEFDGPHTVPPNVLDRSVRWFVEGT